MRLAHSIWVPYPAHVLLEQFFDFEHVPFVHPRTLGRVEVLELGKGWILAELHLPLVAGLRVRSRFREEFVPPRRIEVRILGGIGRGIRYEAEFLPEGEGTEVRERLVVPGLLGWLARLAPGPMLRRIGKVWEEDLEVGMCRGGWPGLDAVGIRELVSP